MDQSIQISLLLGGGGCFFNTVMPIHFHSIWLLWCYSRTLESLEQRFSATWSIYSVTLYRKCSQTTELEDSKVFHWGKSYSDLSLNFLIYKRIPINVISMNALNIPILGNQWLLTTFSLLVVTLENIFLSKTRQPFLCQFFFSFFFFLLVNKRCQS